MENTNNPLDLQPTGAPPKSNRVKYIAVILIILVIAGAGAYFLRKGGDFFQGRLVLMTGSKDGSKSKETSKNKEAQNAKAKAKAEAEFKAMLEKQKAERAARAAAANQDGDDEEEEEAEANNDNDENVEEAQAAEEAPAPPAEEAPPAPQTYGTLVIEKNGVGTYLKVDEDDVTIARFRISALDEEAEITNIRLLLAGSINVADIQNFKLYQSNNPYPISQVVAVDNNNKIVFPVDNNRIGRGGIRSFFVTADLNTGRIGDEIKVYIDQDSDIAVAPGRRYGLPLAIDRRNYDGNSCTFHTASYDRDCTFSILE